MKNRLVKIFLTGIFLHLVILHCFAKTTKMYTDEFLFVNSYLECFAEYSEILSRSDFMFISIAPIEKNIYYSNEEVINSIFMRELKKEQAFISKMIRNAEKYADSSVFSIKNAASAILKRYQKELDINTKAQESYFYTKTRQFKAGLLSADELSEAKKAIKPDKWEIMNLIYDILFPKNSSTFKITREEKESLKNKLNNLKQKYSTITFTIDLYLKEIDDLLNSRVPCLEKIN